jgi:hypothetical protein
MQFAAFCPLPGKCNLIYSTGNPHDDVHFEMIWLSQSERCPAPRLLSQTKAQSGTAKPWFLGHDVCVLWI